MLAQRRLVSEQTGRASDSAEFGWHDSVISSTLGTISGLRNAAHRSAISRFLRIIIFGAFPLLGDVAANNHSDQSGETERCNITPLIPIRRSSGRGTDDRA